MTLNLAEYDVLVFDIEGTVCPISFVKDVLFPYALEALPKVLDQEWDSPEFAKYRDAFPEEYRNSRPDLEAHVRDLVKRDVKIAYLKSLQGYLWLQGYKSGDIVAPLFPDVDPFFNQAVKEGKKIIIYSSGSVPAQKLLFSHTNSEKSDMTPLIADYFDTTNAGPKTEVDSYRKIISSHPENKDLGRWLFLSDNIHEVSAAVEAGIRSVPVIREGNAPLPPDNPLTKLAISEFKHSEDA
ncbi:Enolase-phosphatase E1 [Fusarium kuroshium]|uniref:Enolase-phosphatase E1 n=4 Tax=Fusarium solani species complex TaxID=232080 RepID=A0A3M2R8A2_9HYPO|nr:Enolase-phosphatase E1 [Fusarium kuroshium]RSL56139.1 Enolase-phosphatase E1 [Fusarium floridanum]RSL95508.1 Enolase-phosphatase E1 [Fusarium oligoseptatum]RSM00266.1 Enolase-phosphatase E1 [Fusarium ambrosium]